MRNLIQLRPAVFLATILLGFIGCSEKEDTSILSSAIYLDRIDPMVGNKLTEASIITAQLRYWLADSEGSPHGYRVAILFNTNDPNTTSATSPNSIVLTKRLGLVSFKYPVQRVWDSTSLYSAAHPLTCTFYLQRLESSDGATSTVIAKTEAQAYAE